MSGSSTTGERTRVADPAPARPAAPAGGPPRVPDGPRFSPTSPLRQAGYAAIIVALVFAQQSGKVVADTKYDLLSDPWRFVTRGLSLWDPKAAFGQVPDQSYGYAWPMGPFYALGNLVGLQPWVIQRLWWAALLLLAFFGVLKLCKELELGSELTRVLAGFAFILTPRITTLIGVVSAEVWPMALAPWVLLPLVKGSREGSVRRAGALSALAVVCCGGINAVAVLAVVPLGVIWLLTRAPGPRRWRLLGWWGLFTALGTVWWSGPLVMLGRYAPPFLDYIENATITTLPTDLTRSMLGVSDWVAYFGGIDFRAGLSIVGTPFLLVDAAFVAALGLAGICLKGNPHRRFLVLGVMTGLLLVGLGYNRDLAGFFSAARMHALDQALAPLRNIHKFDVVLRLPLVLGLAHALVVLPAWLRSTGFVVARRLATAAVVLALVGLAAPWLYELVPASHGFAKMPDYWQQTADYLARHDDGTVALELPASSFGVYSWGNVHDDVLQGIARSPWAVRGVVPLAQPGNVVFLDAVTKYLESGRPSAALTGYLAANGVGTLVVRNDLDRLVTGAPDPAYVQSVLSRTPGLSRVASFGPFMGSPAFLHAPDPKHTRLLAGAGISSVTRAVDIYKVFDARQATLSDPGQVLVGDPSSGLDAGAGAIDALPRLLAEDRVGSPTGQLLTDDVKRREMNFPAVRWNESSTLTRGEGYRLPGKEQSHRVVTDENRWETVERWTGGVSDVTASSSQAFADATPPLAIGVHPGAAFDRDPTTAWLSARDQDPNGQWWQATFRRPRAVGTVTVQLSKESVPLAALRISGGGVTRTVRAPHPGEVATFQVGLPETDKLRITAIYRGGLLTGAVGISEVGIDELHPQRWLRLPRPLPGVPVDQVVLSRDQERVPCAAVGTAYACDPLLVAPGEDGDTLARRFTVPRGGSYRISATGSLRRSDTVWRRLLAGSGVSVTVHPQPDGDPATGSGAMVDGDPSTTWVGGSARPRITLDFARPVRLRTLRASFNQGAAASRPARIEVQSRGRRALVDLARGGRGELPHWTVRRMTIRIVSTYPAFSEQGGTYTELPPGITELRLNHRPLTHSVYRTVFVPCGMGPKIVVGKQVYDTTLGANVRQLVRGTRVPLHICGSARLRLHGAESVLAGPTRSFRVDSVTFYRDAAQYPRAIDVRLHRDAGDLPTAVDLPVRNSGQVLTLPQNLNGGWVATLAGRTLSPVRVDGWKQGWLVPAGPAATVQLRYAPTGLFHRVLVAGALLLVLCVVAATPLRLRRRRGPELPPLTPGRVRTVDLVLLGVAAGLLAGWAGLAVLAAAVVVVRRWGDLRVTGGWGIPAALALLVAISGLTWGPLKGHSWTLYWGQAWTMVAVACLAAGLVAMHPRAGRRGWPWAPAGPPSEGSSSRGSDARST